MVEKYADITKKNLENVLKFLPFFENKESKFFTTIDGSFAYSDELDAFRKALVDEGCVSASDYTEWGHKLKEIRENPELLKQAETLLPYKESSHGSLQVIECLCLQRVHMVCLRD